MKVIGLTGGIASGKSTVSRHLKKAHGLPVLDADAAAQLQRLLEVGRGAGREGG